MKALKLDCDLINYKEQEIQTTEISCLILLFPEFDTQAKVMTNHVDLEKHDKFTELNPFRYDRESLA